MNILFTETTDGEPAYFAEQLSGHVVKCTSHCLQDVSEEGLGEIDVLEGEAMMTEDSILARLGAPYSEDVESIALNLALMRHPNLIVTPHMAFYSSEALNRIRKTTVLNLSDDTGLSKANLVNRPS